MLQDKVIASMLPKPQTPTPAERPPPPLLMGVLLAHEIVCCQFNLMSENAEKGMVTRDTTLQSPKWHPVKRYESID
jgi:hypothetical protein